MLEESKNSDHAVAAQVGPRAVENKSTQPHLGARKLNGRVKNTVSANTTLSLQQSMISGSAQDLSNEGVSTIIHQDHDKIDDFDERMYNFFSKEKPFIVSGPVYLDPSLQRTKTNLFLNMDGDEEDSRPSLLRPSVDPYPCSYSFCDLPDLPCSSESAQRARLNLSRSNCYQSILDAIEYDESRQLDLFMSKKLKYFKDSL